MYRLSVKAVKDIDAILRESIKLFGKSQTEKYYNSLLNCLNTLDTTPNMGINIDWIRKYYQKFFHKSHVIYYKTQSPDIEIIRILHKSMDVSKI